MKILIINTAELKGGAAVACHRLHEALLESGHDSKMLVRQKNTDDPTVFEFSNSSIRKKINLAFFFIELLILKFFKRKGFDYSLPWFGPALHKHPLVKNADIIHIHWVQNSFMTLRTLKKLQDLKKPLIWTLHDMWAFTGGCHYNVECRKFETSCYDCPQLKNDSVLDICKSVFNKKQKNYSEKIQIVTPSVWLGEEAKKSFLFRDNRIDVIPYNIDFNLFKPRDKNESKSYFGIDASKKVILFVSMSLEDERKGFKWFRDAILKLEESVPNWTNKYEILAIGRSSEQVHFKTKIHFTGRLSDPEKISMAYAAADVFVAPSMQDNLPNTVIESLACGTPVVAFNIGGMPDMISHQENGFLASFKNTEELSEGIIFCTTQNIFSESIVEKAKAKYLSKDISSKYLSLYQRELGASA